MGIEISSINVRDLELSRPNRTGPGGDQVGDPTVLGADLAGSYSPRRQSFRSASGREVVVFAEIFISPLLDADGDLVPVLTGDFASYTDPQGLPSRDQEIVQVIPTTDCEGALDLLELVLGRSSSAAL